MMVPNEHCAKIAYNILNLAPIAEILGHDHCIIVEVDETGKIIDSLQGTSGTLKFISETHRVGDYLFFGSPYNKYLGRLYSPRPISTPEPQPSVEVKELGEDRFRITIGGDENEKELPPKEEL